MRCKVVVLLLIILATINWSTYADNIVKASEYTETQENNDNTI